MRTAAFVLERTTPPSTSPTQGPAALTSAFARTLWRVPLCSLVMRQTPPSRSAETTRLRVWIAAPFAAASMALSTTRRESSTQQSEYSKAVAPLSLSGRPAASCERSSVRVAGSFLRPPIWS